MIVILRRSSGPNIKLLHAEGITMDGMAMCFHQDQARIVHPWLEESNSNLTYGSLSSARIFVKDKQIRELLLAFCSTGMQIEWHIIAICT